MRRCASEKEKLQAALEIFTQLDMSRERDPVEKALAESQGKRRKAKRPRHDRRAAASSPPECTFSAIRIHQHSHEPLPRALAMLHSGDGSLRDPSPFGSGFQKSSVWPRINPEPATHDFF